MTIPRLESLPVDLTPAAEPPGDRCPGCDAPRPGRYCPQCGERRVDEADYSVTAFARYSLEHLSNLDGNVPRTLVRLWSPGFLATEYFAGRRTRYLRPLQVLLLVSIVVFFVLPGTGLFQWGLEQYRRSGDFAALANRMALADMARTGLAEADFTARFDRALWDQKRTTLLLLVPVFALVTMALELPRGARRVRRYYVEHLVHALHFFAYWLFVIFAILGFFTVAVRLTSSWRVGRLVIGALGQEAGLTLIITLAVGRWLYGSFRRFFEQPRRAAALSTAACTVVFWWLFYEWYQTVAVLGTFVLWSP